jgi:carboxymethylenebutenolidase
MNELARYLAEEIAIDHRDGFITRREALRRLALLGVGTAVAAPMLAACMKAQPTGSTTPDAAAAPDAPSAGTEAITFTGPDGRKLMGAWAGATQPRGAVLVIHENKGLNDHIRSVAARLSAARYSALAIDLLSEEGGTASLGDPANATAALGKAPVERFVADMKAGLDEIARRAQGVKLAVIGFCFGGGMTWRMVASKDERVAAAAPFYGPMPDNADFTGSKAAVLGVYAELDTRVNASRDAAKQALAKAGLPHEIVTYPKVDHAFLNDTGPRYNAEAAQQAWTKVMEWFGKHVG